MQDRCTCGHTAATHLPGIGCYAGASGYTCCRCNSFTPAAVSGTDRMMET